MSAEVLRCKGDVVIYIYIWGNRSSDMWLAQAQELRCKLRWRASKEGTRDHALHCSVAGFKCNTPVNHVTPNVQKHMSYYYRWISLSNRSRRDKSSSPDPDRFSHSTCSFIRVYSGCHSSRKWTNWWSPSLVLVIFSQFSSKLVPWISHIASLKILNARDSLHFVSISMFITNPFHRGLTSDDNGLLESEKWIPCNYSLVTTLQSLCSFYLVVVWISFPGPLR